jgi:DNA ligase-1
VALRFARVLRYRDDKGAEEADTIESVRALRGT